MVLAAGPGARLRPVTDDLPKALVPIDDQRTILDVTLANLKSAGIDQVVIISGHQAGRLQEQAPALERRYGVTLRMIFNRMALSWNNAYSLWCGRECFGDGVLMVNGDTLHSPVVEERILAARKPGRLVLAIDRAKELGEEEMKVRLSGDAAVEEITKEMDPTRASGEYIGVALIEPEIAGSLSEAVEATWRRDSSLYYEDGFQEFIRRGGPTGTVSVGDTDWVEVDDHRDLAAARALACRY